MNQTPNLHLPQWAESDRIRMEDFNDAMQKIDDGYSAATAPTPAPAPAEQSYVVGSYTGDGGNQIVSLGFKPSFLIISGMTHSEDGQNAYLRYFAMTGPSNMGNLNRRVQLSGGGFIVFEPDNYGTSLPELNQLDRKYDYIAFR